MGDYKCGCGGEVTWEDQLTYYIHNYPKKKVAKRNRKGVNDTVGTTYGKHLTAVSPTQITYVLVATRKIKGSNLDFVTYIISSSNRSDKPIRYRIGYM